MLSENLSFFDKRARIIDESTLFQGTSPEKQRFRILNEESSTKMILKVFIKRPQRLDVFTNGYLTFPLNYENGKILIVYEINMGCFGWQRMRRE